MEASKGTTPSAQGYLRQGAGEPVPAWAATSLSMEANKGAAHLPQAGTETGAS